MSSKKFCYDVTNIQLYINGCYPYLLISTRISPNSQIVPTEPWISQVCFTSGDPRGADGSQLIVLQLEKWLLPLLDIAWVLLPTIRIVLLLAAHLALCLRLCVSSPVTYCHIHREEQQRFISITRSYWQGWWHDYVRSMTYSWNRSTRHSTSELSFWEEQDKCCQ